MVKRTYMQFLAERSLCTNLCAAKYCMPTATSRHIPMSTGSDSPYDNREQVCVGLKTTQARTSNYAVPYRSRAMYCWTASLNYSLTHSPCSYCTCACTFVSYVFCGLKSQSHSDDRHVHASSLCSVNRQYRPR